MSNLHSDRNDHTSLLAEKREEENFETQFICICYVVQMYLILKIGIQDYYSGMDLLFL